LNAYELADQVEMWGEDLLALNMKGGIPVVQGAKMLRHQADYIAQLEKGLESVTEFSKAQVERIAELERKHKEEFDYAEKLLKERNK
jgi:hypothetical protein